MKYLITALLTPIMFMAHYILWVLVIGGAMSIVMWDWSIIPSNLFPWDTYAPNVVVRVIAVGMALYGTVLGWKMMADTMA
jgi:hypothetical protein